MKIIYNFLISIIYFLIIIMRKYPVIHIILKLILFNIENFFIFENKKIKFPCNLVLLLENSK